MQTLFSSIQLFVYSRIRLIPIDPTIIDPLLIPIDPLLSRSTGNLSAYPLIDPYGPLIDPFDRQPVRTSAPNMQTLFQFSSVVRLQQNPIDPY